MTTGLEARGNYQIHTRLFERERFIGSGGRAYGGNALLAGLIKNLLGRNTEDERKYRYFGVEKNTRLIGVSVASR